MTAPLVVLDLDGTLIDTAPDLIATLNAILLADGVPVIAPEAVRHVVGGGARVMIARALAMHNMTRDQPALDRLFESFIAHYSAHIADASRPFPGLLDALDELARDGFRFAVCTNKLEKLSLQLLDALNMTGRFAFICGQDTFGVMKPDPVTLLRTIEAAGGSPDRSVMVGDSITDVRTARAARIPVIAVDFGYSDIDPKELAADQLLSSFTELPAAVRKWVPIAGLAR